MLRADGKLRCGQMMEGLTSRVAVHLTCLASSCSTILFWDNVYCSGILKTVHIGRINYAVTLLMDHCMDFGFFSEQKKELLEDLKQRSSMI